MRDAVLARAARLPADARVVLEAARICDNACRGVANDALASFGEPLLADRRGMAGSLERLAWGQAATRRFKAAAWLFGAAEGQHHILGDRTATRRGDRPHATRRGDAAVRRECAGAGLVGGRVATLDEAVARALETPGVSRVLGSDPLDRVAMGS